MPPNDPTQLFKAAVYLLLGPSVASTPDEFSVCTNEVTANQATITEQIKEKA